MTTPDGSETASKGFAEAMGASAETEKLHRIIYHLSAELANANGKLKQLAEIDQAIQKPNTPAVK